MSDLPEWVPAGPPDDDALRSWCERRGWTADDIAGFRLGYDRLGHHRLLDGYAVDRAPQGGKRWYVAADMAGGEDPRRDMNGQKQAAYLIRPPADVDGCERIVVTEGVPDGLNAIIRRPDALCANTVGQQRAIAEAHAGRQLMVVVADNPKPAGRDRIHRANVLACAKATGPIALVYPPAEHGDLSDWGLADGWEAAWEAVDAARPGDGWADDARTLREAEADKAAPGRAPARRLPERMHWQSGEALIEGLRLIGWAVRYNLDLAAVEYALLGDDGALPDVLDGGWETLGSEVELGIIAELQVKVRRNQPTGAKGGEKRNRWVPLAYAAGDGPEGYYRWRALASSAAAVSPKLAWLEGLPEWDGMHRIGGVLDDLLGVDRERTAHPEMALFWMLAGAVRRIQEPGAKHDMALLLQGPRGIGKSTVMALLLPAAKRPEWHVALSSLDKKDDELREDLAHAVLAEVPEMIGAGRAEVVHMLGLLSRTIWRNRRRYDKAATSLPVTHTLYGTTNADAVLPFDKALARRWHPVHVTGRPDITGPDDIDAYLSAPVAAGGPPLREMIWAEARDRLAAGEAAYPSKAQEADIAATTEGVMIRGWVDDRAAAVVAGLGARPGTATLTEEVRKLFAEDAESYRGRMPSDVAIAKAMGRAADELGIRLTKVSIRHGPDRGKRGWQADTGPAAERAVERFSRDGAGGAGSSLSLEIATNGSDGGGDGSDSRGNASTRATRAIAARSALTAPPEGALGGPF